MGEAVSLEAATRWGQQALGGLGIDNPRGEARLLLSFVTGLGRERLIADPDRPLDGDQEQQFECVVARRAAREPMAHILGVREFWSLPFAVTRDTLDPRPDSETVVETALDLFAATGAPRRILDLGTGTGCLLLALLSEWPDADGIGVDIDSRTLAVATGNAAALGLSARAAFVVADWATALDGRFDLVVSNPPYIASDAIGRLEPEVARYEPRRALDGGDDGLAAFRRLVPVLPRLLEPGGDVVFEVGAGQASMVEAMLHEIGVPYCGQHTDLAGIPRCISARIQ
ncbi:MAG: peptide chain release factor N(5)-glutamine methyltransferase [Alphaproteobacteria bacterium]